LRTSRVALGRVRARLLQIGRGPDPRSDDRRVAYLWAVNGVGSVLGAGLTLMLSLVLGGHVVLLAGSALYLLAWTIDRREAIEG